MKSDFTFKCLHCNEIHHPDPRNRRRQRYCSAPDCRRAAKADSQRRWLERPGNENYFRGADNCERVRQWREAHPGYWRRMVPKAFVALQDLSIGQGDGQVVDNEVNCPAKPCVALQDLSTGQGDGQVVENEGNAPSEPFVALQDIWRSQDALIVGLISMVSGVALQDDIALTIKSVLDRGEDILRMMPGRPSFSYYENHNHSPPGTFAACSAPVQLDRSTIGARSAYSGALA